MMSSGTHTETHLGIVTATDDPEKRGRIKVRVDTLVGPDTELPDYIEPAFPFLCGGGDGTSEGWFFVPTVGTVVEVEVNTTSPRDETFAMISFDAPTYRWRRCVLVGTDSISEEFKGDNYPNRMGLTTTAGHAIVFDDTPDSLEVKLQMKLADGGFTFIDFDNFGSAMMMTSLGMMLYMNQDAGELSLLDTNQNALVMNDAGWYITSADSDMVKAGGGAVSVFTDNLLVNASGAVFNTSNVSVNMAGTDTAVLVEGLAGYSTMLASALTEISAGLAVFGIVTPNTTALIAALNAAAFTSVRLSTE